MQLKELINSDLYRYTGDNHISIFSKRRLYGWEYTRIWRKANAAIGTKVKYFIYGFLLYRKSIKYGFQISPHATIGKGLYLGHFGAIVVGKISIGDNVLIAPNAYVNFDVPKDSIVLGNPAVVHRSLCATKEYVNNKV